LNLKKNFIAMKKSWKIYDGDIYKWNKFVESNSHEFRQLYEWGEYKKNLGWIVVRLVCETQDGIESSAQILVKKTFFLGNVFIPGNICGCLENLNFDFKLLLKKYLKVNYLYIRIDSAEKEEHKHVHHLIKNGFKRPTYSLNTLEYCELDLKKTNETILKDAKQKWRYHHKKSLEKPIILKVETKQEHFIEINKELTSDWNIRNTFTEREVIPLIDNLGSKLLACTAFDKDDNLIGIRVAILSGKKAFHLYNAVSKKGRELLPGYRLLIFMLDELRSKDIEFFNIGSTNQKRFPGPYRFKYQLGYKYSLYVSLGEWNFTEIIFLEKILNTFIKTYFNSSQLLRKLIKNF
tara:strand:- start:4052 stop:5098 length:1047 start_codon:yes stop_codon:yes gene_type:complete